MKTLITWIICLGLTGSIQAQEIVLNTVSSAGDYQKVANVQLGWNLGESCIDTWATGPSILTEGFYQNFDQLTSNFNVNNPVKIELYPNPIVQSLQVDVIIDSPTRLLFVITDMNGKIIHKEFSESSRIRFDFTPYTMGTYLLCILDDSGQFQSIHKIIKTAK